VKASHHGGHRGPQRKTKAFLLDFSSVLLCALCGKKPLIRTMLRLFLDHSSSRTQAHQTNHSICNCRRDQHCSRSRHTEWTDFRHRHWARRSALRYLPGNRFPVRVNQQLSLKPQLDLFACAGQEPGAGRWRVPGNQHSWSGSQCRQLMVRRHLHSTAIGIWGVLAVNRGAGGNGVFFGLQFRRIQIFRLLAAHSVTRLNSCWPLATGC
jgi:hypothetical protein